MRGEGRVHFIHLFFSPPAKISSYFAALWGSYGAPEVSEKLINFLHSSVILAVIADSVATYPFLPSLFPSSSSCHLFSRLLLLFVVANIF